VVGNVSPKWRLVTRLLGLPLEKVYQTGRKHAEGFKEDMKIVFDEFLPRWNYRAVPSGL
jgi:hypothetical protein